MRLKRRRQGGELGSGLAPVLVVVAVVIAGVAVCVEGVTGYVARFPTDAVVHVDATESYLAQKRAGSYSEVCEAYRVAAFPYRVGQGVVWLHTRDAVPVTADTVLRVRAVDYDVETQRLQPGAVLAERAFAVRAHVGHAPLAYDVDAVVYDDVFFVCAAVWLHTDLAIGIGVPFSLPAAALRNQTVFRRSTPRSAFVRLPSRGARLGHTGAPVPAPSVALPAEWDTVRCAGRYADGAVCDCECGAPDPDCVTLGSRSPACPAPGAICYRGQCVNPEWHENRENRGDVIDNDIDDSSTRIVNGNGNGNSNSSNGNSSGKSNKGSDNDDDDIFCDPSKFGTNGVCECGCGGLVDPDCVLSVGYARACGGVASECGADLVCSADAWTCARARYGDGRVCDCECGAPDPDCAVLDAAGRPALPTTCADARLCVGGRCAQPRAWTCAPAAYGARDGVCHCGCGALDPDCAAGNYSALAGCASASVRAYSCRPPAGTCAPARCGNGYLDAALGEECDGGTGCRRDLCTCLPGYAPRTPRTVACAPVCGDGRRVPEEECDRGDAFCDTRTCTCAPGHPFDAARGACAGCGNGVVDPGEECDGGAGCTPACVCDRAHRRRPYVPPLPACYVADRTSVITGAAAVAYLTILAGVVVAVALVARRRRLRLLQSVMRRGSGGDGDGDEDAVPLVQQSGGIELSGGATVLSCNSSSGGGGGSGSMAMPVPRADEGEEGYTTIGTVHGWLPSSVGGSVRGSVRLVRQRAEPVAGVSVPHAPPTGAGGEDMGGSVPFSMPFSVIPSSGGGSGSVAAPTLPSLRPISRAHQ